MSKNHLKRLCIPKTWKQVLKKDHKFITKPNPGAHPLSLAITVDLALRQLKFANTRKEVKYLLHNKNVLVDNRRVSERHFAIGLFDVLSVDGMHYRVFLDEKGKLFLQPIQKDVKLKASKVIGKKILKKNKLQINFSDGRNILVDKEKIDYDIGDTVVLETPEQQIKVIVPLKKNARVLLTQGKHAGDKGVVENVEGLFVWYKKGNDVIRTLKKYAFALPEFV
ncbi:hypothetical protein HYV79_00505 [Candidatus Woesearchaeota archaeon]|nr:hypothetical protein [Candidatus Woesearchaeota archaeon]